MPDDPRINIANALASKLIRSLTQKSARVLDKYLYYDADNDIADFGISTPLRLRNNKPGIGWASRAVNVISDRVTFDGFGNDRFSINATFDAINAAGVISQSKHDTFIGGCSFIAVLDNPNSDKKQLMPFTALEATGEIDQATGLMRYGLAVTKWGEYTPPKEGLHFFPSDYVVFTADFTAVFIGRQIREIITNETGRCLLHPLTHRASANKPLGKSRITNTARRIINEVGRLKRREEIAEEFYALPQRYIVGLAQGAEKDSALDSAIGKVWTITKDDDGDAPDVGQLQQMSIDGFVGAKKDKARDFCAETALTLRNLGYETGNPTSAESLTAMSDDMLLEATNSQEEMGNQIKQIAITLRMSIDGISVVPDGLNDIVPAWKPIFQIDVGAAGDAVYKISQAMPELMGTVASYQLLGIGIRQAEALQAARAKASAATSFMNPGGAK